MSEVAVTRDGRFKREVRRMARASGEPYTRVRARLEASRRRHDAPQDEPRWIVAFTFAGAEDWAREWLLSRHGGALGRVLVPRYEGRLIVPGMLLLEVAYGAAAGHLVHLPPVTYYRGEPAAPVPLSWDGVRQALREEQLAVGSAWPGRAKEDFVEFRALVSRVRLVGSSRGAHSADHPTSVSWANETGRTRRTSGT